MPSLPAKIKEMPNASGKMNQLEREICARFKVARERLNQSERNLALILGVTRDQLAGVEYGRTPLKSGLAVSLAKFTGCNLNWLADGTGPLLGPLPTPDLIEQIPPRSLFSAAWRLYLKKAITRGAKYFGQGWEGLDESLSISGLDALTYTKQDIEGLFNDLPRKLEWNAYAHIAKACRDYRQMNQAKIPELNARAGKGQNKDQARLDNPLSPRDTTAVLIKSLPDLIGALKKLTKERGMKVSLADKCQVSRQAVDQWLNGSRKPSAEAVFAALEWVRECKPKK